MKDLNVYAAISDEMGVAEASETGMGIVAG